MERIKQYTVRTKRELQFAKELNVEEIVVCGSLATRLYAAKKVGDMSRVSLSIITSVLGVGAIAAVPTGGLSLGVSSAMLAPIAVATGLSVEALMLIGTLGATFVVALCHEYDWEYDFSKKKLTMKKRYKNI